MIKNFKVTLLLPKSDIDYLDKISERELTGSRGRAISWLIRKTQTQEGSSS